MKLFYFIFIISFIISSTNFAMEQNQQHVFRNAGESSNNSFLHQLKQLLSTVIPSPEQQEELYELINSNVHLIGFLFATSHQ